MELEVGGIDCVSHWFENNSRIRHETCRPGNERTWPWKDSNCGIVRDFSDENSIVATEKRREKRMAYVVWATEHVGACVGVQIGARNSMDARCGDERTENVDLRGRIGVVCR
jgi:hypothetical protein